MKQQINEIKRLQKLAGIINEEETANNEEKPASLDTIYASIKPLEQKYSNVTFTKDDKKNVIKITGKSSMSRAIRIKLEKNGKFSVIVFESDQFFGVDDYGKEFSATEVNKIPDFVKEKIEKYEINE